MRYCVLFLTVCALFCFDIVRIWFQNKRANVRKQQKKGRIEAAAALASQGLMAPPFPPVPGAFPPPPGGDVLMRRESPDSHGNVPPTLPPFPHPHGLPMVPPPMGFGGAPSAESLFPFVPPQLLAQMGDIPQPFPFFPPPQQIPFHSDAPLPMHMLPEDFKNWLRQKGGPPILPPGGEASTFPYTQGPVMSPSQNPFHDPRDARGADSTTENRKMHENEMLRRSMLTTPSPTSAHALRQVGSQSVPAKGSGGTYAHRRVSSPSVLLSPRAHANDRRLSISHAQSQSPQRGHHSYDTQRENYRSSSREVNGSLAEQEKTRSMQSTRAQMGDSDPRRSFSPQEDSTAMHGHSVDAAHEAAARRKRRRPSAASPHRFTRHARATSLPPTYEEMSCGGGQDGAAAAAAVFKEPPHSHDRAHARMNPRLSAEPPRMSPKQTQMTARDPQQPGRGAQSLFDFPAAAGGPITVAAAASSSTAANSQQHATSSSEQRSSRRRMSSPPPISSPERYLPALPTHHEGSPALDGGTGGDDETGATVGPPLVDPFSSPAETGAAAAAVDRKHMDFVSTG